MLTDNQLASFKKVDKQAQYYVRRNIALLVEVSKELDQYSQQQTSDLRQGLMRINNVVVPIKTGMLTMFIDHYPMSYVDNVVLILQHMNKTNSTMARWFITRSVLETIYERARISLITATTDEDRKTIQRFRGLSVLDFELHLAQSVGANNKYIPQYLEYRASLKKQTSTYKASDLALFPESSEQLSTDRGGANRTRLLSKIAKPYAIPKPDGYKTVYQTTSRLIHGNPLQTSVTRHLLPQWRERFLIDGLIIKSCGDLFNVIGSSADISKATAKRALNQEIKMQQFYESTLKPTWHQASTLELG